MAVGVINSSASARGRRIVRLAVVPLIFYLSAFIVLTYPLLLRFKSEYFTDRADGYQMVWDMWWVRHAIVDLHQWPLHTNIVHYPGGASLWLHSLGLFNGLIAIPLHWVLSDIQTFNVLVTFAFVGSGITAFWLCLAVTRRQWPSLAGGFTFAFCSYRWAHYFGHLPVISTEWMPLYLLTLLWLLRRPRIVTAAAASLWLSIILLIDPYQFMDCMLTTALVGLWWIGSGRFRRRHVRRVLLPAGVSWSLPHRAVDRSCLR